MRVIAQPTAFSTVQFMIDHHANAGHTVVQYVLAGAKHVQCETCLNRKGEKSARQMSGRRFRECVVLEPT